VIARTLLLAFSLYAVWYGWHYNSNNSDHLAARYQAIKYQAESFPRGQILLIGDSLSEYADVPTLCGRGVLNAGIAGATTEFWSTRAKAIVDAAEPSTVIIELGTNDTKAPDPAFRDHYRAVMDAAKGKRHTALLVAPFGRPTTEFRSDMVPVVNAAIVREAGRKLRITGAPTIDGVHMTRAGRAAWVEALRSAC
jgi:lysophospholipase L1-like esterase